MNRNRVITLVISAVIIGLFLQFVYAPKAMEVKKLRLEYKKIKSDISGLYDFIGGEENLKDNLIKMRTYAPAFGKAFPY